MIDLTTPAVLLSTISLLILAYTNRFLTATNRTRELYKEYRLQPIEAERDDNLLQQIKSQVRRIRLIRDMLTLASLCLFIFVLTMFLIYNGLQQLAHWTFWLGLLLLMVSLALSTRELYLSTTAIEIHLKELAIQ
jgi:hypothetical protein